MKNILRIVFLVVFSSNAQQKDSLEVPKSENYLDEIVIQGTLKPVSAWNIPLGTIEGVSVWAGLSACSGSKS